MVSNPMLLNVLTDIVGLQDQLDAAERDAERLVTGLSEELGTLRLEAGSSSVAECLDHLATGIVCIWMPCWNPRAARERTEGSGSGQRGPDGDVRAFLSHNADLDLAGIRFPNPFVRGIRCSVATGLHVIAAHERRHLWRAAAPCGGSTAHVSSSSTSVRTPRRWWAQSSSRPMGNCSL